MMLVKSFLKIDGTHAAVASKGHSP